MKICYEDNHLIAVFKPAGVLSQGDKSGDMSMVDKVKKYLKEKYQKPGNVFVGLLHRLDRPVSGIMLFAKTSKGASRLSEQFRNRQVEKTYHALVAGRPKGSKGVLVHHIKKIKTQSSNFKSISKSKADEVVLYYEVIKSANKYTLLKITIEGGKFHQIRAQLSLAKLPILGDVKYGGPPLSVLLRANGVRVKEKWSDDGTIALCATGLHFKKATENKMVNLSIALPKKWSQYISYPQL